MELTDQHKHLLAQLDPFLSITNDDEDGILLWMNDTFSSASSDTIKVEPVEIAELHRLLSKYGWCGAVYWASKKDQYCSRSAFKDVNRFIDFVTAEEKLRADVPESNKRAYYKLVYTLGEEL